jgi:hypothetical protein
MSAPSLHGGVRACTCSQVMSVRVSACTHGTAGPEVSATPLWPRPLVCPRLRAMQRASITSTGFSMTSPWHVLWLLRTFLPATLAVQWFVGVVAQTHCSDVDVAPADTASGSARLARALMPPCSCGSCMGLCPAPWQPAAGLFLRTAWP